MPNSAKPNKRYKFSVAFRKLEASIQLLFAQFPFFNIIIHHQNLLVNWL